MQIHFNTYIASRLKTLETYFSKYINISLRFIKIYSSFLYFVCVSNRLYLKIKSSYLGIVFLLFWHIFLTSHRVFFLHCSSWGLDLSWRICVSGWYFSRISPLLAPENCLPDSPLGFKIPQLLMLLSTEWPIIITLSRFFFPWFCSRRILVLTVLLTFSWKLSLWSLLVLFEWKLF